MTTPVLDVDPAIDAVDDHDPPVTVDLRLAAPAVGAWLAALAVVRAEPGVAALGAAACVVVVGASAAARRWTIAGRVGVLPGLARTFALALLAVGAVLGAGASQTSARAHGLLPDLAATQSAATLTGRVVGEPALLPPAWPGAPPRARCTIAVDAAAGHGQTSAAVGQVLVIGPPSLADEPYGARVRVAGRLQVGAHGDRVVAVLLTSGDPELVSAPARWDVVATGVGRMSPSSPTSCPATRARSFPASRSVTPAACRATWRRTCVSPG